ncbi:MAG TPA: metal-dependent hydrolase [Acidimicrobiales bacterium]|nr:metal-dependent hydrolase [Acidimicrobiales bacterium]
MILWFAGMSVAAVWVVFRDPAIDLRLVIAGALLPDVVDGFLALAGVVGPWPAHTLLANAGFLMVVMVATRGRRQLRRRLLALPIGGLLHLALDGAWADTVGFWWPAFGTDVPAEALPSIERGATNVVLELAGLIALVWAWSRFRLGEPARRAAFLRTGRVGRDLVG